MKQLQQVHTRDPDRSTIVIELTQNSDPHHDEMDLEDVRPALQREESETTKIHNETTT